ncbi:MAG: DUF1015 family protein [Planctomycetaceae bacterium]
MPTVLPLRGLRYDPKHVGALSQLIAPPFDAIDDGLRARLYERHPANAVRLEGNREEPGDGDRGDRWKRAARFLRAWQEQGLLMREPAAAVYVCQQAFEHDGRLLVRRGLLARVRLERLGTGNIHAHEDVLPGPVEDRLGLLRACRANLSPVLIVHEGAGPELRTVLDEAVAGQPPVEAVDDDGTRTSMWPVVDEAVAARAAGLLGPTRLVIADGHHRYEAACRYRDEVAEAWPAEHGGQPLPPDHPANFVLAMLVGADDPGLVSLPVHRTFRQPVVATAAELSQRLGDCFTTRSLWRGPAASETVWNTLEFEDEQGTLALYTAGDQVWSLARITPAGRARLEQQAGEHGPAWRGLGAAILQRLVLDDLLGGGAELLHTASRIAAMPDLLTADGIALATLAMPVGVKDMLRITETGERLPAGSTRFHPPAPCGLVFSPLG